MTADNLETDICCFLLLADKIAGRYSQRRMEICYLTTEVFILVHHEEKMAAPGRGTLRGMGGNSGTDKTLYEILVGGKDYDNAMGILKALK